MGEWRVKDGELFADAGDGPKLICDEPAFANGEASVEVFFPDAHSGNASMIVKVDQPGVGADKWNGYEVGLEAPNGVLMLGRHRNNWEPIQRGACELPINRWVKLT